MSELNAAPEPLPPEPPGATAFDIVTAYHEAGHAVMALLHERPVHKVSILPNTLRLGVCEFAKGVRRPSDDWLEASSLISLAGMVAERHQFGAADLGGARSDLREVRKLATMRASGRTVERLEARMLAKAEMLLTEDPTWQSVEAIAAELLKHGSISGRAARHHFERFTAG